MPTINDVTIKITCDAQPALYGFWFVKAAIRTAAGMPTPMHELMVKADLWAPLVSANTAS